MSAGCDGHADLASEVRTLLLAALDRLDPVLQRVYAAPPTDDQARSGERPCAVCPVCAALTAWRGERSELAAQAAHHLAGLAAVLRTALVEGAGASRADGEEHAQQPRPVHRISVIR